MTCERDRCECCADAVTAAEIRELTSAVRALISQIHGRLGLETPVFSEPPEVRRASSAKVRRAAARVRVRVDKEMGSATPEWIRRLAEELEDS